MNLDQSMRSEASSKRLGQELSFLNIHALNKSFLEKSSSSEDSSKGQSFDMSSGSNPYETSSESSNEQQEEEEVIEENISNQKLTNLQQFLDLTIQYKLNIQMNSRELEEQLFYLSNPKTIVLLRNLTKISQFYFPTIWIKKRTSLISTCIDYKQIEFKIVQEGVKSLKLILSNRNIQKIIKKLNLPKFDVVMFYIAACLKDKEDDYQMLYDKIKFEFFDKNEKQEDEKITSIIYNLIHDQKKNDKVKIGSLFVDNSAYFMQRVLEDKQIYYELFQDIIQCGEININLLIPKLFIQTSTLYILLTEKKYDQLLFLVKNNVRIMHTQMISFINQDDMSYDGYLNKPLLKINLKLLAIYYTEKMKDVSLIKKFLFDVRQTSQEYQELLKVFIRYRVNSLAKDTFRALIDSNYTFDNKILNFTLLTQNFEFLWFLANHESVALVAWLNEEKTQKILVDKLYYVEGTYFEYIIYYLKKVKRFKVKQTIKRLSETLIHRIQSCRQGQFLYTFYNPLKVVLLVIELLHMTMLKVVHHKNRLNKAHELYYKFAQIYCSLITDDQLLIELFKDVDLEKRKVIFLIDNHKSLVISSTQSVEDAIEVIYITCNQSYNLNYFSKLKSMWNGNIAPKTSLFKMFTVTQNLFFSELSDYIMEKHPKKNEIFMEVNTMYQNHHFSLQRVVWTYNCRIRNQIDQCLILTLMLIIFANFSSLFEPQHELQKLLQDANYNYNDIAEQELVLLQNLKDTYFSFQIILDVIIGMNFTFKPLFILYYDWTQEVQTKFTVQDFSLFILGLFSLFQWVFISYAEQVNEPYRFDVLVTFRWMYIVIIIIQCILCLRNFKVFGPMIKALWLVVLECSKFSFIFIVVIMLFGFMAYFSFFENVNDRFKSLAQTLLFLVEALFGQFSFADFSQPSPIYAPIFLNTYLFFAPIIFMQLLVAVLTFTFETASRSGRIHYFLGTIENLRNLEYDAVCGCLVALPIVGNFFNVIFILTHMLSDPDTSMREQNIDTLKKVNRVLVRLGYFPIYVVLSIICICMILFFSPIFYVVKFFRILGENNKGEGYSKGKRLMRWVFLGYYYMMVKTIEDFKRNYDYLMHGKFVNDSPQMNISNNTYSIMAAVAKDYYLKTKERQNKILLSDYLGSVIKKMKTSEQRALDKIKKAQSQTLITKEGQPLLSSNISKKDNEKNSNESSEESQSMTRERNGQSIPKSQNTLEIFESRQRAQSNAQNLTPLRKDIQTLNMIKEISSENVTNPTEMRNSHRNFYFTNKIRSLISHDSEDQQQSAGEEEQDKNKKKVQIGQNFLNVPSQRHFQLRPIRAITQNYIADSIESPPRKAQDDLPKRQSRIYEDEKQFKLQIELIKSDFSNRNKTDSKINDDPFNIEKKVVLVDSGTKEQNKGAEEYINGDMKDEQDEISSNQQQIEKRGSLASNLPSSNKMFSRDNYRLQVLTHHSSSSQPYDSSMQNNRKRRKTTFQMWKKLKKDDYSHLILKDTENLYQFIDAFVVDEEEPINDDNISEFSLNDKDNTENNEYIYIENLLKLMYHYSKNDVKLARFNILFQAIKKLFKES